MKPWLAKAGLGDIAMSDGSSIRAIGCFRDSIELCCTFRQSGCVLAWWLIAGMNYDELDIVSRNLLNHFARDSAKDMTSGRSKEATFPIREGELADLVDVFTCGALVDITVQPFVDIWFHKAWVYVSVCALNRLAGVSVRPTRGRWSAQERRAVESIGRAVERRCVVDSPPQVISEAQWQKEMSCKHVGYSGEEVSTCCQLTWDQVIPALPPEEHGGSIDTLMWVGARTREFLLNPDWLLKPSDEVQLPKMPGRVHIREEDKFPLAQELVRRRICDWIPLSKVHKVNNTPVLNGLFGVEKSALLEDGRSILRLIMNLTGSNSTQRQLEGGCKSLPSITAWQSMIIDEGEEVTLFQSDMSSAFYLFKLPGCWKGHLAFNVISPGNQVGGLSEEPHALCCAVIPMGWLNSVGIMQEMAENLLLHQSIPAQLQVRRDKALPPWMNEILSEAKHAETAWWHVYLDNYAGGERILPTKPAMAGKICHELAEEAWRKAGVISSEKKRIVASKRVVELGAEIDGEQKMIGASTERLGKLIRTTLWLVVQPFMNRKHLQIVAGRWMFVLQFRRTGMSFVHKLWKLSSGTERVTEKLKQDVRAELLSLVCCCCLFHCNLGAGVSKNVICTDASEKAGAVEMSEELSTEGIDFLMATQTLEHCREEARPILLISLFNGIGGTFRCYDVIGIVPAGRIAVELDEGANRITSRRWPGTLFHKDVRTVDREVVRAWSLRFLRIAEIHLWAGWPCVDLSRVKHNRLNLSGPQSSLLFEVLRIKTLLEEEFGWHVTIKHVFENVASMDASAAKEISDLVESVPYQLDCCDAVPMRRPRYAWTSEKIEALMPDVTVSQDAYWKTVTAKAEYPDPRTWVTPGYDWAGLHEPVILPTCLKSIPRESPPPRPAGLNKCDAATKSRWQNDCFRYPPYQYQSKFLFTTPTTWRLVNAEEKELLLGYGFKHTCLAWPTSKIKQNRIGFSDARHKYLGDAFSVFSFVILAAACCRNFLPHLTYKQLASRMGLAPGFRAHIRCVCPLVRSLSYGSNFEKMGYFSLGMEFLNRFLLRHTNHTGSDVRVMTGEIFSEKAFPRQSVASGWWKWKSVFQKRWVRKAHINVLELETILLGLKYQISRLRSVDQRIFQLTDSYICQSVVSKGRSSSVQLSRVLDQISAHLLAFGLQMVLAHVESADNPADDGSRA